MDTITAMAIPRSSHSVAVLPAATTTLEAKTIQPWALMGFLLSAHDLADLPAGLTSKSQCDSLHGKDHGDQ